MPNEFRRLHHLHKAAYFRNQEYNKTLLSENEELFLHVHNTAVCPRLHRPVVDCVLPRWFRSAYWKSRDETSTLLADNRRLKALAELKMQGLNKHRTSFRKNFET